MMSMISNIFISGYSVKGPLHIREGLSNQDSYIIRKFSKGILAVVADGMGSHKYSDKGSKAACEAVFEAVKIWSAYPAGNLNILPKLIQNIWNLKVSQYDKSECGTTCLFSLYLSSGRIIFGQLGDGLIAYKKNDSFFVLNEKNDDFSNETISLHCASKLSQWLLEEIRVEKSDEISFIITTDGVSEDLILENRQGFMETVLASLKKKIDRRQRKNYIRNIFKNWNTKYHTDDKTLIIFEKVGIK